MNPSFIAPLAEALAAEDVFAAGCLALEEKDARVGENLKAPRLSWGRLKFSKLPAMDLETCRALLPETAPTLFATGGFMAFGKGHFLTLGGFDPLFEPFYYEEADLCWRAWKRGYRVLLVRDSVVMHRHRGTILSHHDHGRVRRIQERNRTLLLWKNLTDPGLFWGGHVMPLAFRFLFKWMVLDWNFYAALFGAVKKIRGALAGRHLEKEQARTNDRELFRVLQDALPVHGEPVSKASS
ncbi:MAG: hypothetical protein KJ645_02595 [Planctomycetes bacterium]|nr:hypothetical protein [Planctomycetota bacterium]